jgi:hypothetical protein
MTPLGSPIAPPHCPLILRNLIDESKFFGQVSGHTCNESSSGILVAFGGDALKSFLADASAEELIVDDGGVNGDELIGLEEVEHFIKEVVWIAIDKA